MWRVVMVELEYLTSSDSGVMSMTYPLTERERRLG